LPAQQEGLAALGPDHSEVGSDGDMEAILPILAQELLPVVGLGGSAGSIGALRDFFSRMPADSGMGFVVVVHLSPEHESILAAVLGNVTPMRVVQVTAEVRIEPNCVYVIPPGKQLSMVDGHLRVVDLQNERGRRVVVDLLLQTLADTHGPRAMAVVLSGADGDGSVGIKRIKERGGLTIAQEPGEAEHESMPRSAIATGMIDWVLPVAEMPARLLEYRRNEERLRLPVEDPPPPRREENPRQSDEVALRETLAFLRMRTGRDFSYYKRGTILRRIGRRMQVNGLESLPDYLLFLRTHPGEAGALLQDLLISVTNFFRDREAFAELKNEMPRLFKGKQPDEQVRVWVAGCATGEEAYSVAMILSEYAEGLEAPPLLQVFGTDIDENAIRAAREGFYSPAITADVSAERLRQFFTAEPGGYRVKRAVRETVLFAPHDLLKDSPFSRIDLITCRNLLIYVRREAQTRAFDLIHFALRQEGLLFLGGSESAEMAAAQFRPLNKKHRLYTRLSTGRTSPPLFTGPSTLALSQRAPVSSLATWRGAGNWLSPVSPLPEPGAERPAQPPSHGELHFKLLESFAPPSVVVDASQHIVHLSEHAGRFVQFTGGEPTTNVLRAVHPMLRLELRSALFRVSETGQQTAVRGVPVESNGGRRLIDLSVHPGPADFKLIIFQEREPAERAIRAPADAEAVQAAPRLERELEAMEARQREVVEQYEASVEELKASNEELQAMNEELRSATEELETGREELQSINEELNTVNHELKGKVEEVDRTNSDLQNLMASTRIATVFLDRDLRIKRFTPSAVPLFNLIPTDIGRPLSDLSHQLRYPGLTADAQRVLDQLVPVQREISTSGDRWLITQILPYRTMEDRIAGLVLTFVDITTRKEAEESLRAAGAELDRQVRKFDAVVTSVPDFIFTFDLEGRFTYLNKALLDLWQIPPERAMGRMFQELAQPSAAAVTFERQIAEVIALRQPVRDEMDLGGKVYDYILAPILGTGGAAEAVAGTTRDITARKQAERELRAVKDELATELAVMTQLHELGTRLLSSSDTLPLLEEILDAAIGLQHADFGSIQLCDRVTERLLVSVQRGLEPETVAYLDSLEDPRAACGGGLRRERVVIEDVAADPGYEIHRQMAQRAGFRAVQSTPLFDRAGAFVGILATYFRQPHRPGGRVSRLTDLYARQAAEVIGLKVAEEKVRASEDRYRLIFDSTRDFAILTVDLRGAITSWNPGAAAVFGYASAEIVGQPFASVFTPEDRAAGKPESVLAKVEEQGWTDCERWHVRKDGTRFWGSGIMTAMTEDGRPTGYLKIMRDTTVERQAMEERLLVEQERANLLISERHARQEAESANEAKDRFLAILSHELRTPLAPIHMTLYTLEHEKRLSALGRESLAIIRRSVEMEVRLIDDLLDVSRIVHGKLEARLEPMDLHACVRRAIEVCEEELAGGNLRLVTALEAAPSHTVGDAARLRQVFWNLLKNAAKFSPGGGVITVRSRNCRRADGTPGIILEVADTGIGIEPDVLPDLFNAFEQGGPDVARRYGGLGLGLAIASGIVQMHGGTITAASEGRGKGTVITVELSTTAPIEPVLKASERQKGE
jgi:two-component system CheB/CheR fusion protein